jgi:putative lipoic acid-binding regulatory protein
MEIVDNKYDNPEDFYQSLKEKLDIQYEFPQDYLFKFIIENDGNKIAEIYKVFDGIHHTLGNRESKNGKYISASINAFVLNSDHVIDLYKKVGTIEGVMML